MVSSISLVSLLCVGLGAAAALGLRRSVTHFTRQREISAVPSLCCRCGQPAAAGKQCCSKDPECWTTGGALKLWMGGAPCASTCTRFAWLSCHTADRSIADQDCIVRQWRNGPGAEEACAGGSTGTEGLRDMGFTLGGTVLSAFSSSRWAECVLQILAMKQICKAMVKEALGICMSTPALHSEVAKVFVTGTSLMCTPDSELCAQGLLSKLADESGMWPCCTSPAGRWHSSSHRFRYKAQARVFGRPDFPYGWGCKSLGTASCCMMLRAMMAGTAALLFSLLCMHRLPSRPNLVPWKARSKVQGGKFTASTRMLDRTWLQIHS